jgi:hypothetical protein
MTHTIAVSFSCTVEELGAGAGVTGVAGAGVTGVAGAGTGVATSRLSQHSVTVQFNESSHCFLH